METELDDYETLGGTILPKPNFDPQAAAQLLKKALKGIGTDTSALTKLVAGSTNMERQLMADAYKRLTRRDLIEHIKSDTSGNYEDVLVALMTPAAEYDAKNLHQAITGYMKGYGQDLDLVAEILSSRNGKQIQHLREAYKKLYNKDLLADINQYTSPDVKEILLAMAEGNRADNVPVDGAQAQADAKAMFNIENRSVGANIPVIKQILGTRSFDQLRQTFDEHRKQTKQPIDATIKSLVTGKTQNLLLNIIGCIQDPVGFFAQKLKHSLKGIGTKESELIRVLTTRSEVDLDKIKQVYAQKFGRNLEKAVRGDVHGKFQDVLVSLIRGNR